MSEVLAPEAAVDAKRRSKRSTPSAGKTPSGKRPSKAASPVAGGAGDDGLGAPLDRVLLVDDRKDNLVALEAVLQPLGYELLQASSGTEALRILLDVDVAAIVLDVQMPGMDGFETAELLKSRAATRTIPILFLTAVGHSLEHELRGYEVGGVDYICKPFEPKVLQAKVRSIVNWSNELRALARSARVYEESGAALSGLQASGALAPAGGPGAPAGTPLLFAPPLGELVRSEQEHLSDAPVGQGQDQGTGIGTVGGPGTGGPGVAGATAGPGAGPAVGPAVGPAAAGVGTFGGPGAGPGAGPATAPSAVPAAGSTSGTLGGPVLGGPRGVEGAGGVAPAAVAGGGGGGAPRRFLNLQRVVDLELEANLDAPAKARAAVRAAVERHSGDLEDILVLLVSELVTNAVLHARSTAMIRLDLGSGVVRFEIQDAGSRLPDLAVPALTDESGRGLLMVQQLASRYGWTQLVGGKSVWFELDLPGELPGRAEPKR